MFPVGASRGILALANVGMSNRVTCNQKYYAPLGNYCDVTRRELSQCHASQMLEAPGADQSAIRQHDDDDAAAAPVLDNVVSWSPTTTSWSSLGTCGCLLGLA